MFPDEQYDSANPDKCTRRNQRLPCTPGRNRSQNEICAPDTRQPPHVDTKRRGQLRGAGAGKPLDQWSLADTKCAAEKKSKPSQTQQGHSAPYADRIQ
jgi:hypothetical protein